MNSITNYGIQKRLKYTLQRLETILDYKEYDVVVSHCEVNNQHGVGILIQRFFPANKNNIFSIRSSNLYDGSQSFGEKNQCLFCENLTFDEILIKVQLCFKEILPKRIISIPYFPGDYLISLALKKLYDSDLCVFIMDDQNIFSKNVSDVIVKELLNNADLCLGISRPLCSAYETKFNKKFWFVPPLIEEQLIAKEIKSISNENLINKQGVIIGNIWSQHWLDKLRWICKSANIKVDWYGNPNRQWLLFDDLELEADGIYLKGFLSESELSTQLHKYSFAIIPTSSSDDLEDRPEIAKLSLPSRICFIVATSHLPILVVGNEDTAVAQFIKEHHLGAVCQYKATDFQQKINYLCQLDTQLEIRQNAFNISQKLDAKNIAEWIWLSLDKKEAIDLRFENLSQQSFDYPVSLVVTPNEVNQQHGTGALVKRIFPNDSNIISVRSDNHYNGVHNFGFKSYHLAHRELERRDIFNNVIHLLKDFQITRIFCVPYYSEDLITAIAAKEIFGVPMGTYIMDDQNICVNNIPDELMREFLEKCTIRFATHPELRDAYENKYGLKFWLLPAIVPDRLITQTISIPEKQKYSDKRGALIGSLWSQQWFNALCSCIQSTGIKIDWFGNSSYYWLTESETELNSKGIYLRGLCTEDELAKNLRDYPFIIVPTGTLDENDDRLELSKLSLPGRIIFNLATANTPIILFGSPNTSAGKFINRFKIGVVCDYSPESFKDALEYILDPSNQQIMRANAANVAQCFSDKGIEEWVWQSLAEGQVTDLRFESLLPRSPIDLVHFIEPPVSPLIYKDYAEVYQVMRRLKGQSYQPDFIVDVGASHGIWSHTASQLFPQSQFILIDPLISRYEQAARNYYIRNIPKAKLLEIAVSNQSGQLSFQVSPDLYGSSLLTPADFRNYETVTVEVKTLDQIKTEEQLVGRGILKLDVQCAEHIVLEGAKTFLEQIDLIVAELSFVRYDENALIFLEMLNLLDQLGFRYYDETGEWRSPIDGTLLQKEVVFIRHNLLVPETSRAI